MGRLQALEWASQWDRVRFAAGNGRRVTRWLEGTSASPDSVMISLEFARQRGALHISAAVAASVSAPRSRRSFRICRVGVHPIPFGRPLPRGRSDCGSSGPRGPGLWAGGCYGVERLSPIISVKSA